MQCLRESTEIHHNDASLPRPANLVLNDDRKRSEYSENPQRISAECLLMVINSTIKIVIFLQSVIPINTITATLYIDTGIITKTDGF